MASAAVSAGLAVAGPRTATATPCLVIVISSPAATSSRRRGRWVFASYAPTRRIPILQLV